MIVQLAENVQNLYSKKIRVKYVIRLNAHRTNVSNSYATAANAIIFVIV